MASLPYPSFVSDAPVSENRASLAAVGTCRIHPAEASNEAYQAILELNIQQADTGASTDEANKDANKKLQKKYMKQGVAAAQQLLMETLQLDVSIIHVQVVLPAADVIRSDGGLAACFLDAGCQAVVLEGTNSEALDAAKIPPERLVAHFDDTADLPQAAQKVAALCRCVSVSVSSANVTEEKLLALINSVEGTPVQVHIDPTTCGIEAADLAALVGKVCTQSSAKKGTIALIDPTVSLLGRSYAACVRTDREDGLFTTVVCSRSGEALGLVYSSTESIVAALECGRGVYYSRSRKGLWRKGDTSGHIQSLHRLDVDCDGDALRFVVTQRSGNEETAPAFCHLETYTCWGDPVGLRHLQGTLQDRLKSAPAGSYTKRLFEDSQLLRDKLVEEAQELSEAESPKHVAEELADVLYFCMTRAVQAGVSIDDAVAELDRRTRKVTRRKGDSKAFRIAAGQAILEGTKKDKDDSKKPE